MLEYQNHLLRERCQRLHAKLLELVAIARDNDRLSERVQRLALGLLDARGGLDELLHGIKAILRDEFKADCIALCLAAPSTTGLSARGGIPAAGCDRAVRHRISEWSVPSAAA
ncbi:MAG: DUF484 family protein [Chromatiales bacterium]|nr:DUF484 family protein [Chromatiales bacterium]